MMHYVSDYSGTLSFPQTSLNHYRQRMVVTQEETTHQIKSLIMLQFPTSNCPICLSEQLRVIAHRSLLRCDFSSPTGTFRDFGIILLWFPLEQRNDVTFSFTPWKIRCGFSLWWAHTSTHQWRANIRYDMFCSGFQLSIKLTYSSGDSSMA